MDAARRDEPAVAVDVAGLQADEVRPGVDDVDDAAARAPQLVAALAAQGIG